jgi:hypothetical protein
VRIDDHARAAAGRREEVEPRLRHLLAPRLEAEALQLVIEEVGVRELVAGGRGDVDELTRERDGIDQ